MTPDKFWSRVDIQGPEDCWEWTGYITDKGYGRIRVSKDEQVLAHVLAFDYSGGKLKKTKPHVLHRCDNRPCCNPAHLFAGTKAENNDDRDNKGRAAKGFSNGKAKLTPELIALMVAEKNATGISYRKLGLKYNLKHTTVANALQGKTYQQMPSVVTLTGEPVFTCWFNVVPSRNIKSHWRKQMAITSEWRYEARVKALTIRGMGEDDGFFAKLDPLINDGPALVVVSVYLPHHGIADIHNIDVKPILDGFSDAGVYEDDEWAYVPLVLFEFKAIVPKFKGIKIDVYKLASFKVDGSERPLPEGRVRL